MAILILDDISNIMKSWNDDPLIQCLPYDISKLTEHNLPQSWVLPVMFQFAEYFRIFTLVIAHCEFESIEDIWGADFNFYRNHTETRSTSKMCLDARFLSIYRQ
jgi:hypothetical protein